MTEIEKHYTVSEVAEMWGVSPPTVQVLFRDQPGVLKISAPRLLKSRRRRPRVTLRIPLSIVQKIHGELSR